MKRKLPIISAIILSFLFCGCNKNTTPEARDYFIVHFNTCTDLETNVIADQHLYEGDLVDEPAVIVPGAAVMEVKTSGWYLEKTYATKWDFESDVVTGDMTLYAKWCEVHTITYYLKGTTTPIWTVGDACDGDPLEQHDELCDGYHFEGYFEDAECTIPFDLEKPLYDNTIVYMKRDNVLNLNPSAIKRRFSAVAAGGTGSEVGYIDTPSVDEFGNEYVDVNYGYSRSGDPYIQITNPVLDISESQTLQMTFKNLGKADSFTLFWVTKYENGTYAGGTSYYDQSNSIEVKLNQPGEKEMDPNKNEWLTKTIDISSIKKSGISTWGNSVSLVKLRLQFRYISTSRTDLSNVVRFKSIVGIPDPSKKGFVDSEEIQAICVNDSDEEIAQSAAKQAEINNGLIFPKNNEKIDVGGSKTFYKKKDGILMYSPYGNSTNKYVINVNSPISCDYYSYLRIQIVNYSYISSLDVSIKSTLDGKSKTTTSTFSISSRTDSAKDYYVNLFEMNNFVGEVISITFKFGFVGVDNAILLKEVEFMDSRAFQVPGINFNDNDCAGFVSNEDISVKRNSIAKGSDFTVEKAASISSALDENVEFDSSLYTSLDMIYFYSASIEDQEINKVTLKITTEAGTYNYLFSDLVPENAYKTIRIPYTNGGLIKSYSLDFDGKGTFTILKITFGFYNVTEESNNYEVEGTVDLSSNVVVSSMLPDWKTGLTYDNSISSSYYSSVPGSLVRYYFGNRYESNYRKTGNVCLENKTKVYIIYQWTGEADKNQISLRLTGLKKSSTTQYRTAVGSETIMGNGIVSLKSCKSNKTWLVASVDIDSKFLTEEYYVSQISFTFDGVTNSNKSIYVRGLVIK